MLLGTLTSFGVKGPGSDLPLMLNPRASKNSLVYQGFVAKSKSGLTISKLNFQGLNYPSAGMKIS